MDKLIKILYLLNLDEKEASFTEWMSHDMECQWLYIKYMNLMPGSWANKRDINKYLNRVVTRG